MTTKTVQPVMLILLVLKACELTYSVPVIERENSPRHGHVDENYSMSFVLLHKMCSRCTPQDRTPHFARFLRESKLKGTQKYNSIRSLKKGQGDVNQLSETRPITGRPPFVMPLDNILKLLDHRIRMKFYDNVFDSLWKSKARKTKLLKKQKKIKTKKLSKIISHVLTTPSPLSRKIRSTVTVDYVTSDPLLPVTAKLVPTYYQIESQVTFPSTVTTFLGRPKMEISNILSSKLNSNNHKINMNATKLLIDPNFTPVEYADRVTHEFAEALDKFDRKYYTATFGKLSSISPPDRRENGISFVESGLFLYLILSTLSIELDQETKSEIDSCLASEVSDSDKINIMQQVLDNLPSSSDDLKFHWSTRLVVNSSWHPTHGAGEVLRMQIDRLLGYETPEQLMKKLNDMVEKDSGGAMRNTFEEEELAEGVSAVLINTVFVRPRWRSAPTLLNGSWAFHDADGTPNRTARMICINDVMRYAYLTEWDAQIVEISYTTPGLSLLLLVPRGLSLRALSERASAVRLSDITARMRSLRVAVTLPIYTLRMTLLLPNKLQAMGISRLVTPSNDTNSELMVSHAVQRLMFWAEAGRNAFKDDGNEWDERPELEMMVDRPYLFYVRWHNLTLMNGNFVL